MKFLNKINQQADDNNAAALITRHMLIIMNAVVLLTLFASCGGIGGIDDSSSDISALTPKFKINLKTFSLRYADKELPYLTDQTVNFTENKIPQGKAVYSVSAAPVISNIKISPTGVVTVPKDTPKDNYTITVTAKTVENSGYTGSKQAAFSAKVVDIKLTEFFLRYENKEMPYLTDQTVSFTENTIPQGKAVYSVSAAPVISNLKISAVGVVTVPNDTPKGGYTLTVTAKAVENSGYAGSKQAVFTIKLIDTKLAGSALRYVNKEISGLSGQTVNFIENDILPGKAVYSVSANPAIANIKINRSGVITIPKGTASDTKYKITVKAEAVENSGYAGSRETEFEVTVLNSPFLYKPDPNQQVSNKLFTIGDVNNPFLFVIDGVTDTANFTNSKITIHNADKAGKILYTVTEPVVKIVPGSDPATVGIGIPDSAKIKFAKLSKNLKIVVEGKIAGDSYISRRTISVERAGPGDLYSWRDLDNVRNNPARSYTMKNNIAFPKDNTYGYGTKFKPIGNDTKKFRGNFDGGGYTLSNLKIFTDANDDAGLFGHIRGKTARRVTIKNLTIRHKGIQGRNYVGVLAGKIRYADIISVAVKGSPGAVVKGSGSYTGGLVGYIRYSTLTGNSDSAVTGNEGVGGLVGNSGGSTVKGYATGAVSGGLNVGGLVGHVTKYSTISGYATGAVSGGLNVGGLVGHVTKYSTISGYATGAVIGSEDVGGLIGDAWDGSTITGYATGAVSGVYQAGGLIGELYGSTVTGYATGAVSGGGILGGLVGDASDGSTITGYATGAVTGYYKIGGLAGISYGDEIKMTGYARGYIIRKGGYAESFGLMVGFVGNHKIKGYSSGYNLKESRFINIKKTDTHADSAHGKPLAMNDTVKQADFSEFTFGIAPGQWSWKKNHWPAINIGDISPADSQPTLKSGDAFSPPCEGTAGEPPFVERRGYQISTPEQLQWMNECLFAAYELTQDIDLSGVTWTPVGTSSNPFRGTFDGKGKTIKELSLDAPSIKHTGLFGYIRGTAVNKVVIKDVTVDHKGIKGESYVGALAGMVYHAEITGVMMKSTAGATIVGQLGDSYIGGLVGDLHHSILSGHTTGDVGVVTHFTSSTSGGLAGKANKSKVNGYTTGAITGKYDVGGLVGSINGGTLTGYATGKVTGVARVGGLVGITNIAEDNVSATVNGYAVGAVTGSAEVGGLIGNILRNSFVTGYARGKLKIKRDYFTKTSFGLLAGRNLSTLKGYHSKGESNFSGFKTGETPTGMNGDPITVSTCLQKNLGSFTFSKKFGGWVWFSDNLPGLDLSGKTRPGIIQNKFENFRFSTKVGEWTCVQNGRWPAINLPDTVGGNYKPADQPTGALTKP